MTPSLSILMPAKNAEAYIRPALESLLAQNIPNTEVIVINDGSTDRTPDIARQVSPSIKIIEGPQKNISSAMNTGLAAATGALIARCDADDLYTPGRLARQRDFLDTNPDFVATSGSFGTIDAKGRFICDLECAGPTGREITDDLRKISTPTHLCTYLIRADALHAIGGFRPYFETAEDIDLQLRLGEYGRVWYDPKSCYHYRLHDNSITHASSDARRAFFEDMARVLQAQRLADGQDDVDRGTAPAPPDAGRSDAKGASSQMSGMLMWRAWQELSAGNRGRALATGTRACLMRPTHLSNWKNLALLAVKPANKALGER